MAYSSILLLLFCSTFHFFSTLPLCICGARFNNYHFIVILTKTSCLLYCLLELLDSLCCLFKISLLWLIVSFIWSFWNDLLWLDELAFVTLVVCFSSQVILFVSALAVFTVRLLATAAWVYVFFYKIKYIHLFICFPARNAFYSLYYFVFCFHCVQVLSFYVVSMAMTTFGFTFYIPESLWDLFVHIYCKLHFVQAVEPSVTKSFTFVTFDRI